MTFPEQMKLMLRRMVEAQDKGAAIHQDFADARFELTFIDRLMVEVHNERLRMVNEGLPVLAPPESPEEAFMLGFVKTEKSQD